MGAKHPQKNVLVLPALVGRLSHEHYRRGPSPVLCAAAHMYMMRNEQRAPDAAQPAATLPFTRWRGPVPH